MSIEEPFDSDDEKLTPEEDERRAERRRTEAERRRLRAVEAEYGNKRPHIRHERTGGRVRDWEEEDND